MAQTQNNNYNGVQTNLKAKKGEFINKRTNGVVPEGTLYHIHPVEGPMEGAIHHPNIHGGTAGHDYFIRAENVATMNTNVNRNINQLRKSINPIGSMGKKQY